MAVSVILFCAPCSCGTPGCILARPGWSCSRWRCASIGTLPLSASLAARWSAAPYSPPFAGRESAAMTELWRLTARQRGRPAEARRDLAARHGRGDGRAHRGDRRGPQRDADTAASSARATTPRRLMTGEQPAYDGPGALHGLPLAVKELDDVDGVQDDLRFAASMPTTCPTRSDIMVERLEARGAIIIGKSNVPEFGAGGASFNEVFGPAANPWDMRRTPGGSSGGSAASLAVGQTTISTGSDLGGSLRIPSSFCGIVGFRPSPGIVAHGPSTDPLRRPAGGRADGAQRAGRRVDAGRHDGPACRGPAVARRAARILSGPGAGRRWARAPRPNASAIRRDLGITPVDAEVDAICRAATERLAELGSEIVACHDRFLRCAGIVPYLPRARLRQRARRGTETPPRQVQAGEYLEHRKGYRADPRGDLPRVPHPRRAVPSHAGLLPRSRRAGACPRPSCRRCRSTCVTCRN